MRAWLSDAAAAPSDMIDDDDDDDDDDDYRAHHTMQYQAHAACACHRGSHSSANVGII